MLNWLFGNDKKKKKKTGTNSSGSKKGSSKRTAPTYKTSGIAESIDLPQEMRYIDLKTVRKIMHSIIQTYKMLDYGNKKDSDLSTPEWHSWQVGIMFKLYQSGDRVFIGKEDRKKIFPKSIQDAGEGSAQRVVENFAEKYSSKVNLKADRDTLSRDVRWTPREVSNLLYLITED